jgi:hypothetical protein
VAQARLVSSWCTFVAFSLLEVVTFIVCFSLQEKYKDEVIKKHNEGFDWENETIDGQAVYDSASRKEHG